MNQPQPRYSLLAKLIGSLLSLLAVALFVLGIVAAVGGSVLIIRNWIL